MGVFGICYWGDDFCDFYRDFSIVGCYFFIFVKGMVCVCAMVQFSLLVILILGVLGVWGA
jgi:hypothetical protein